MVEQTIVSRYVSLLSQECYNYVMSKSPKDGLAASKMVQEFEESRGFAGRPQPWQSHSPGQHNLSALATSATGLHPTMVSRVVLVVVVKLLVRTVAEVAVGTAAATIVVPGIVMVVLLGILILQR